MATLPTGAAMAMMVVLVLDWLLAFSMPLVWVAAAAAAATASAPVVVLGPAIWAAPSTAAAGTEAGGVASVSMVVGGGALVRGADESGGRLAVPVDEMSEEMDESRGVEVDPGVVGVGLGGGGGDEVEDEADEDEDDDDSEEVVDVELGELVEEEVEDVVPVRRFPMAGNRPS